MRIAARNEPGKCADAVSTVPAGKVTQVFFYRIVKRNEIGGEKAGYIPVPHLQPITEVAKTAGIDETAIPSSPILAAIFLPFGIIFLLAGATMEKGWF